MMYGDSRGFTLLETLLALFLLGLVVLWIAPMFLLVSNGNAASSDLGEVGAIAVERMEILRAERYDDLTAGGSLTSNVAGYSDVSNPGLQVRWVIVNNLTPPSTKIITLRATALRELTGPRRDVTLSTLRGD